MKSKKPITCSLLLAITVLMCPETIQADVDIIGEWNGKWVSEARGQSGPLVATFSKKDNGTFQAVFEGRFFKIFPFRFVVPLILKEQKPESITLTGKMNAGDLFGTFQYTILATNEIVEVKYHSERDHGVFRVTRGEPMAKEKEKRRKKRRREETKVLRHGN